MACLISVDSEQEMTPLRNYMYWTLVAVWLTGEAQVTLMTTFLFPFFPFLSFSFLYAGMAHHSTVGMTCLVCILRTIWWNTNGQSGAYLKVRTNQGT